MTEKTIVVLLGVFGLPEVVIAPLDVFLVKLAGHVRKAGEIEVDSDKLAIILAPEEEIARVVTGDCCDILDADLMVREFVVEPTITLV